MKTCGKCQKTKPASAYFKHKHMKDGLEKRCKDCRNAEQMIYKLQNARKIKEREAKYRAANREIVRQRSADWRDKNIEAARASVASYKAKNLEKTRASAAAYFATPRGKAASRAVSQVRRARKRVTMIQHIKLEELIEACGLECYICKIKTDPNAPRNTAFKCEMEHVIPLSRGGSHTLENLRISCAQCNRVKGASRTPEQARQIIQARQQSLTPGL